MITLSLLRHAKSAWDNPGLGDFDRPLAPRGEKAAPRMGRFMADHGVTPDLVLCSTAVRARQTLDLVLPKLVAPPQVDYRRDLYGAGAGDMLMIVKDQIDAPDHIMLVGHNPGMHEFALGMTGTGDDEEVSSMAAKYPTAALAVIDFDGRWDQVTPGLGRLRLFKRPREL